MRRKSTEPVTGKVFEKIVSGDVNKSVGVFEGCRFVQCSFAQTDFSGIVFRDCAFEQCDLSMMKLGGAALREVRFTGCKLLGVQFSECRKLLLEMSFERCMMRLSLFTGLDLKNTTFIHCDLQEADFTGANLSGSIFSDCDLRLAIFFHTNLEKADLRTAFNFSISPESNRLRKAKFSLHGLPGLLESYDIDID
ncbi:MAG: pentapeptide repeat-containing protein [Chlorobiaceae bacterium]|nr:pentapeptide repeat-containing protein [Chlorobiaceae bacterium]